VIIFQMLLLTITKFFFTFWKFCGKFFIPCLLMRFNFFLDLCNYRVDILWSIFVGINLHYQVCCMMLKLRNFSALLNRDVRNSVSESSTFTHFCITSGENVFWERSFNLNLMTAFWRSVQLHGYWNYIICKGTRI
jgi:hypothetical protein